MINPEKSCWIYAGYEWMNGSWSYVKQPNLPMVIPLPDGLPAMISQAEVSTAEKALGVWLPVDGYDTEHLSKNVTGRFTKWASKMTNGHLLARLGWIAYKFKLCREYGTAYQHFQHLFLPHRACCERRTSAPPPILGINWNVKHE